ncbi:MAG: hypothetical protein IJR13_00240 [Bacteroidales bacterium]|nr:hypothetical protein [Bacteroidales bacterium]MBQ7279144.1 hypothetical protein [Bacteroidales bacterium]
MHKTTLITGLFLGLVVCVSAQQNVRFADFFCDSTLRVDYLRTGCKKHDTCTLCKFVFQNDTWAGSQTQLLDPIDNGEYRILVKDAASGRDLYSRCYNTLFEEYRSTIPSRERDSIASFEETMLMPFPKHKVVICLQKRDKANIFFTSAQFSFDPTTFRSPRLLPDKKPIRLLDNGDPHSKIDIVIVAEGYGRKDARKMKVDFQKFAQFTLEQEPFKSRAGDFNIWGVGVLMNESGVTDPNQNRHVESAVGSSYNTFNMDRYLMTTNIFRLHDMLRGIPYDHIIIMANCDTYGGGAIYNYYAFSAVQEMSMWILPHELGHSIGGLADEYVEDDSNYNRRYVGIEPLEPNITSLVNFESKWKNIVPDGTPIPTEPVKGLGKRDNGPIGAYEGAGYLEKGCYRPCTKCMMRDYAAFCPVCTKRLHEVFDLYVK